MIKQNWVFGLGILLLAGACLTIDNKYSAIPPGPWRAILEIDPQPMRINKKGEPTEELMNVEFEEVANGELPFTFDVVYDTDSSFHIVIHNGEEEIVVDDIDFGRRKDRAKDSIRIDFPVYDSYITALYEENVLEGYWVVNYRDNYRVPFKAFYGQNHRFTKLQKEPIMDVSGSWEATFELDSDAPYPAIAEFEQNGNDLRGTFRTETGDYRFLAGTIQADKLYLSVFDGAHAFLFEAKILPDSTLIGSFRSGQHYSTTWKAQRNPNAQLVDPNDITTIDENYGSFDFAFPNTQGDTVRLSDPAYAGKAKLIQIMGTWCPNCKEETEFLKRYMAENPNEDLVIISLAFERYRNRASSQEVLQRYKQKMGLDWEVLLAGYYDKSEASEVLPMLNKITSYPTLLYVDRNNTVQSIHTGFNGKATSKYDAFVADFEAKVNNLLAKDDI